MTADLFGERPKKPRRIMAHVADAGDGVIEFECTKCGWNTGWMGWDKSVSEAKRGIPCVQCNEKEILHLHLKFKYFDEIAAGEKPEEYRDALKWQVRLDNNWYSHIRLYRGFEKVGEETVIDRLYNGYELKVITHPHFDNTPTKVCAIDVTRKLPTE